MWPGFFINGPGWGRHGSMNWGRDPRHQAVGSRDVVRDQVLHGFGGVVEVAATALVVVVSLVLPVQLEMRKVRDSTRHRPRAGQCQRLPKHGNQQDNHESSTGHGLKSNRRAMSRSSPYGPSPSRHQDGLLGTDASRYRRVDGSRPTYTAKGLAGNPAGAILTTSTARPPSPLKVHENCWPALRKVTVSP